MWRSTGLSTGEVANAAARIGMPLGEAAEWIAYLDEIGYVLRGGDRVNRRNFRRSLRMWHKVAAKMSASGASVHSDAEARRCDERRRRVEEAAKRPGAWRLCAERCARFGGGRCTAGVRIPPDLAERPCPPEECRWFVEREVEELDG